jgi:putative Mg2+ transporter-C (MgtC) family protein
MTLPIQDVLRHMLAALAAGAVIGTERSFHGRAAGFRTHALVCLSSSLLMLLTVYQGYWFPGDGDTVRMDPTRMAQGIMTGIGFLGAGVIFKEGLTVRGLTTAASIWITAAIGVLMGVGLYLPGAIATVLVLGVLALFRYIENRFPTQVYANLKVTFSRDAPMPEPQLRSLLAAQGFKVTSQGYEVTPDGGYLEYRMAIRTVRPDQLPRLAETLASLHQVRSFDVSSGGE